jgi:regulator of sigma E protease
VKSLKNATNGVMVTDSLGFDLGLKHGDKIVSVGGKELDNFKDFTKELILYEATTIEIIRDGAPQTLKIPATYVSDLIKKKQKNKSMQLIEPRFPIEVNKIEKGFPGDKAGLKLGDKIVGVNNVPTPFYDQMKEILDANKSKTVTLAVLRAKDTLQMPVKLTVEGRIGFQPNFDLSKYYEVKTVKYNFLEAIPAGIRMAYNTLDAYVRQFKLLFSGQVKAKDSLGGFVTMANAFGQLWDWQAFWSMTALISIILAFVNILPIPALDGGHVLFLLYEMVTRKAPPQKFMEYAQMAGMAFLLGLMLYANGLDIFRLIIDKF